MKSLLEEDGYAEIKNRLDTLDQNSVRVWGKMNQAQMLTHCQFPLKVAIENKPTKPKWNPIMRLFKGMLYNDKLWRKGLPTAPELKIVDERDFHKEKETLEELVDAFYKLKEREEWNPHPMFGNFTKEQWGKMEYKHLDHHLRQFGV